MHRFVLFLPDSPETEFLQQRTLSDAKRLLGNLKTLHPDDVPNRERLIKYLIRLARLESSLGRLDDAEVTLKQARELAERLILDTHEKRHEAYLLATLNEQMHVAYERGQREELKRLFKDASVLDARLSDRLSDGVILEERSRFAAQSARLARVEGQLPKAEEYYRTTLVLLERLVETLGYPDDAKIYDLAIAHSNLASVLLHQRKHKEAAKEFEEARRLIPDDGSPRLRDILGQIQCNQGVVAEELKRPADAAKAYTTSAYIFERLHADYPSIPVYRYNWAKAKLNLAVLAGMNGQERDAREHVNLIRPELEKLVKDHPTNAIYQAELKRLHEIAKLVEEK